MPYATKSWPFAAQGRLGVARLAAALVLCALAATGTDANPVQTALPSAASSEGSSVGRELTQADADAWLDGFMPGALSRGDIAGAVVVIVKDGRILTQRGFGYADIAARQKVDPETTLFRVGSTSKLFTWTAVMQLVEQGKIDLDTDVNRYLDFKIPPYQDKPITMRQIMTHTSGFEDAFRGGIAFDGQVDPLGRVVKRMLPSRVYDPGSTPAYSNYATALAGYIVERVSGLTFDDYIERNIFRPLGMSHSSFRQPLPAALTPFMAKGYPKASVNPKPFELISVPPAGSLSMTGADAAKFMISQLNQGAGLLKPATAQLMQTPEHASDARLNRMALGFYEQRINDLEVIAHGGDLSFFHGYMWLYPQKNVGLLVEMNSAGEQSAPDILRQMLFEQFSDRYFPAANARPPVELPTAQDHARLLTGSYISSRGAFTNFVDINNLLSQVRISLDAQGRPLVPDIFDRPSRTWIEVEPFLWQDALGHARLGALVKNDRVVRWSIDEISPFMVYDRAPWYRDAVWLLPSLVAALAIILLAAVAWPVGGLVQRYGRRHGAVMTHLEVMRRSDHVFAVFAWLVVLVSGGWVLTLVTLVESMSTAEWPIWLLQIAGTLSFFGLAVTAIWKLVGAWKTGRGWFGRLWGMLLVAASAIILWVALAFHLIGFGAKY
jgi:CubicO group peptidase (beta-lactamase class C family)